MSTLKLLLLYYLINEILKRVGCTHCGAQPLAIACVGRAGVAGSNSLYDVLTNVAALFFERKVSKRS